MNDALITRWNERVQPEDIVYHLGDFAVGLTQSQREEVGAQLNGQKVLVMGNHDRMTKTAVRRMHFEPVKSMTLEIEGTKYLLRHRMLPGEMAQHHVGICGHVHNAWRFCYLEGKLIINAGVDVWHYRPVALSELLEGIRP